MVRTVKARFSGGVLKPLERLDLNEGDEVTVSVTLPTSKPLSADDAKEIFERTAGGWADLIDCEKLERDIYESRLRGNRPKPEF